MKDEEYLFHSDVRDKKVTARSARNTRTHNGKRGRVKLPSDYMTKKEINAMNGEVKSYRLNEPMSWNEFKEMPDDIKCGYIKLLREKYGVSDTAIAKMMGVNQSTAQREFKRLGVTLGKGHFKKNFDKEGWIAWCNGVPAPKKEAEEEIPVEEEVTAAEEETAPIEVSEPEAEPVRGVTQAIPYSGTIAFEGKVEEVMNSVSALLGNAYAHISITWDVLPEPIRGCNADG